MVCLKAEINVADLQLVTREELLKWSGRSLLVNLESFCAADELLTPKCVAVWD